MVHPHIKSMAMITFQQENADIESFNMNNPSRWIRKKMGYLSYPPPALRKKSWNEFWCRKSDSARVQALREATTSRRLKQGRNITASYDFLPCDHPRGYGTAAPQAGMGATEDKSPNGPTVEEVSDSDDDQHMETGTTQHGHYATSDGGDASTKANMTINVDSSDAEDGNNGVDELSQMSDYLSIGGRAPKANKRTRHGDAKDGTTVISLTVKLDMEPSAIVDTLTTALGSEASNTFTAEIVYAAYARDVTLKDVYLTVAESVDIATLLRQLTAAFPRSYLQVVGGIPHQPYDARDLDRSPN